MGRTAAQRNHRYVVDGVDVTAAVLAAVDAAPPLSEAQRDRLRILLQPVAEQIAAIRDRRRAQLEVERAA
jgi:hypothetical protein